MKWELKISRKPTIRLVLEIVEEEGRTRNTIDHKQISNYKILSITGNTENSYGQINEEVRDLISEPLRLDLLIPRAKTEKILSIWERWHLNDMRPNCIHQTSFSVKSSEWKRLADEETKKCPVGYGYGSAWLVEPLPVEVEKEAIELFGGEK